MRTKGTGDRFINENHFLVVHNIVRLIVFRDLEGRICTN